MNDSQFYDFIALMMCSDPWPDSVNRESLEAFADEEARQRGYDDWIDALHRQERPMTNLPFSGSCP